MHSFTYTIKTFETDIYGLTPPSMLLKLSIYGTMLKAESEGSPGSLLLEKLGAVWMLARVKLEQYEPVRCEDELTVCTGNRCICKGTYQRQVKIYRGETLVACSDLAYIVVEFQKRAILRPNAVEEALPNAYPMSELTPMRKVAPPQNMQETGQHTVSYRECDANGHLYSGNYADIVCEHCGYWHNGPFLMRTLQIDFNAECRPGETLRILTNHSDTGCFMRGIHENGAIGFTAGWCAEKL